MIPVLLWRCPQCATEDALREQRRLLRPLQIHCGRCGAIWRVRRVIGEDYWLTLTACPASPSAVGTDLPLARWYAQMKRRFALTPKTDTALALVDGESLYLATRQKIRMFAEAADPLFFDKAEDDPEGKLAADAGLGRLFLTSRRLAWRGDDGKSADWQLAKIVSVYAQFGVALLVLHGSRLYEFRLRRDGLLKWVTYFAYVGKEIEAATGHTITTSHF